MLKIQVGQVWKGERHTRRVVEVVDPSDTAPYGLTIFTDENPGRMAVRTTTFKQWIRRDKAQLEQEGENGSDSRE